MSNESYIIDGGRSPATRASPHCYSRPSSFVSDSRHPKAQQSLHPIPQFATGFDPIRWWILPAHGSRPAVQELGKRLRRKER